MSRIAILAADATPAAALPLLDAVKQSLGVVPNLMKMTANSPAALEGYLALNGAAGKGVLDLQTRERIALAVAQYNHCDYCLSVHSYLGANLAKLPEQEISAARDFRSANAKADAALRFAQRVLAAQGRVSDSDIAHVRAAGFEDAGLVEIVANVALNVLTNYLNNVAQTELDFPAAAARA